MNVHATTDAKRSSSDDVLIELLKPLSRFLGDRTLFEIVINRAGEVWTEGLQGWRTHAAPELNFERLRRLARVVASSSNQSIDDSRPLLSATLPGGERIQIVIPPAVPDGTISLTIRKPSTASFSLEELHAHGLFEITRAVGRAARATESGPAAFGAETMALLERLRAGDFAVFLRESVKARLNILISGATGSGKTTLSKALIRAIPDDERIMTIEDTPELVIPQPNHVRLFYSKGGQGTAKVSAKELLEACLRMRPDRILLQELRDEAAFYYINNVNSGHPGSITTVHANSARLAFERLTLLVKESAAGRDLERDDIRNLLMATVDIVVQCKRVGGTFRVTEIYFDPVRTVDASE